LLVLLVLLILLVLFVSTVLFSFAGCGKGKRLFNYPNFKRFKLLGKAFFFSVFLIAVDITTDLITAWNFFSRSKNCRDQFTIICHNVSQFEISEETCKSFLGQSMSICIEESDLKNKWWDGCLRFLAEFKLHCDGNILKRDSHLFALTTYWAFYRGLFTVIPVFAPLIVRIFINFAMLTRCFEFKDYCIKPIPGRLIRWKGDLQKIAWNFPLFQPIRLFYFTIPCI
jgi:hypothetical protein